MVKMAKIQIPKNVFFRIRPANGGLNYSLPPQSIDMKQSPDLMNVRFSRNQITKRSGFKGKYFGATEPVLWIDVVYSSGGTTLVAFTNRTFYKESNNILIDMDVWDGNGGGVQFGDFSMDPTSDLWQVDVGEGKFDFSGRDANGGAAYPTGGANYADLMFVVNSVDGIFVILDGSAGVEAEYIGNLPDAPSVGIACAVYDNRLVIGGPDDDPSMLWWSAQGTLSDWSSAGSGYTVVGDGPDWIQTLKKMGEYLIVYKERSIYIGRKSMVTDPAILFDPAPGQGIGLAAPNSVGDLGEEHIFLGWDDVYIFSLKGIDAVGSRIKDELFYGDNGILPEYIQLCTGIIAEEFDEYWLFVPSGKIPEATNVLLNGTLLDLDSNNVPDNWTVNADGNGTATKQSGGHFGGTYWDLSFSTGTYIQIESAKYDFVSVITGNTLSLLVWLKTDIATNVKFIIRTWNSGETAYEDKTLSFSLAASSTFAPYIFSCVIADVDAQKVEVFIENDTANAVLSIDAVQLVDITSIDSAYIYETPTTHYQAPGYIGPNGTVTLIPYIIKNIGPWVTDTVWVYNYEDDAWSAWRIPITGFGYDSMINITRIADLTGYVNDQTWRFDEKLLEALAPTNLIAQPDGQIYEASKLYSKDWEGLLDIPILFYWESKDFDLGNPSIDKTLSRLTIFHESSHPPTVITVGVTTDSGMNWTEQDITIRTGDVQTFADFFVTGSQVRFRVKATNGGVSITGFAVKIIPRGESNAY